MSGARDDLVRAARALKLAAEQSGVERCAQDIVIYCAGNTGVSADQRASVVADHLRKLMEGDYALDAAEPVLREEGMIG